MWASDHRPILISFASEGSKKDIKRFYFDKRWSLKPGFEEVLKRGWNSNTGKDMAVSDRIWKCRHELSRWKRCNNTNSEVALVRLKNDLETEISKLNPDHDHMSLLKKALLRHTKRKKSIGKTEAGSIGSNQEIKILSISTIV